MKSIAIAFVAAIVCAAGWARAGEASRADVNSLGMRMVELQPGEFRMGSPAGEKGREEDETLHTVKITRPFAISATEVTQAQWAKVMGGRRGSFQGDDLPVESVSWNDAVAFCQKLSKLEGQTYRLPTEAEWEYACRAGADGPYSGSKKLEDVAWFDDNAEGMPHAVGTKKPNKWGLYDMHGNVAEWCADYYGAYPANGAVDPTGAATGKARVIRGGSWSSFARGCRCASRSSTPVAYQLKSVGFRVVREAAAK